MEKVDHNILIGLKICNNGKKEEPTWVKTWRWKVGSAHGDKQPFVLVISVVVNGGKQLKTSQDTNAEWAMTTVQ